MKASTFQTLRVLAIVLAAVFALSACSTMSTIEGRTKEKSAVFAAAAPWQQRLMREGWVDVGFTPDMVYIAIGQPDKTATADNGATEIWIYDNFASPSRAFNGGVKVSIQAGSDHPGMGVSPTSPGARGKYLSGSVSPDLGAASVDPVPRLYVIFRQGKLAVVESRRE